MCGFKREAQIIHPRTFIVIWDNQHLALKHFHYLAHKSQPFLLVAEEGLIGILQESQSKCLFQPLYSAQVTNYYNSHV